MKRLALFVMSVAMLWASGCKKAPQGEAREFLMWSMDQHNALKSFAAEGEWQRVEGDQADSPRRRVVLYVAPNKFKVLAGVPDGFSLASISDGKSQAEFCTDPGIEPIGQAAPSSLAVADTPFLADPGFAGSLLYRMFAGRAGIGEVLGDPQGKVEFGGTEKLPSGEEGREVKFYAKAPYGNVSMVIGRKSGLVRRIQFDREPLVKAYLASDEAKSLDEKARRAIADQHITEQYGEVTANPDLSKEVFDGKVPDAVLVAHDRATAGPRMVGKPAPDFTLTSLDGKTKLRLKDVQGKPVFIDFWATWCGPCRMSLPHTQDVYKRNLSKGTVMAISNEKPEVIRKFLKESKMDIPVYLDPDGKVAKLYNVDPLPSFVLIDSKGKVMDYMGGFNEERLKSGLAKAGLTR